jgi:hypothetical protein
MTKQFELIALVLFCLFTFLYYGCCPETGVDNTPPATENGSLYWMEVQGRFATNDLARAQAEIPFNIVLPTYIPDNREDAPLPHIEGPFRISIDDNEAEVIIRYLLYLGNDVHGHIFITERNSVIVPPDPELNPGYEYLEMRGKRLVKMEGNFALGPGTIFYFNHDNIYFKIEVYNFSTEEAMKIVESLIQQSEQL